MTPLEFNQQYDSLYDLLFAFAMKLTRNVEDAKDLMQETVTNAYANRHRFEVGTNFKAWITTIMRNAFINEYRKRRTRNKVEEPIENVMYMVENKPSMDETDRIVQMKDLGKILDSLNIEHRLPFLMFFRGYQYNEIAEHFDLPIGTVKSRIYFAREKLKNMIQRNYAVFRA